MIDFDQFSALWPMFAQRWIFFGIQNVFCMQEREGVDNPPPQSGFIYSYDYTMLDVCM